MDFDVPIIPSDKLSVEINRPSDPSRRALWRKCEAAWEEAAGRPPSTKAEWREVVEAYNKLAAAL